MPREIKNTTAPHHQYVAVTISAVFHSIDCFLGIAFVYMDGMANSLLPGAIALLHTNLLIMQHITMMTSEI
jgi:hypothetical protein